MARMIILTLAAAALASLAACGERDEPVNNSGVTLEEAQALDNASNMLDASPDSLIAVEDPALDAEGARLEDVDNMTAESGDLPVTGDAATTPQ